MKFNFANLFLGPYTDRWIMANSAIFLYLTAIRLTLEHLFTLEFFHLPWLYLVTLELHKKWIEGGKVIFLDFLWLFFTCLSFEEESRKNVCLSVSATDEAMFHRRGHLPTLFPTDQGFCSCAVGRETGGHEDINMSLPAVAFQSAAPPHTCSASWAAFISSSIIQRQPQPSQPPAVCPDEPFLLCDAWPGCYNTAVEK